MLNITKIAIASVSLLATGAALPSMAADVKAPAAAAVKAVIAPAAPAAAIAPVAPAAVIAPTPATPAPAAVAPVAPAASLAAPQVVELQNGNKVVIKGDMVFVLDAKGAPTPAPDGDHVAKDGKVISTVAGKIVKK